MLQVTPVYCEGKGTVLISSGSKKAERIDIWDINLNIDSLRLGACAFAIAQCETIKNVSQLSNEVCCINHCSGVYEQNSIVIRWTAE